MERTGLLLDIDTSVNLIYKGRACLDIEGREGEGRISYNKGLALALATFKAVQANVREDLEGAVLAEQAYLAQELAYCAPIDRMAANSLANGITGFDEGLLALKVVEAGSAYRFVDQCLPHRKETRFNKMPKDSFHYACSGQLERLNSILHTPGLSLTEKAVTEQRIANIAAMQAAYTEKQQRALVRLLA